LITSWSRCDQDAIKMWSRCDQVPKTKYGIWSKSRENTQNIEVALSESPNNSPSVYLRMYGYALRQVRSSRPSKSGHNTYCVSRCVFVLCVCVYVCVCVCLRVCVFVCLRVVYEQRKIPHTHTHTHTCSNEAKWCEMNMSLVSVCRPLPLYIALSLSVWGRGVMRVRAFVRVGGDAWLFRWCLYKVHLCSLKVVRRLGWGRIPKQFTRK